MLTKETTDIAVELGVKATASNVQLSPEVDTPLANLVGMTQVFGPGIANTEEVTTSLESIDEQSVASYIQQSDNSSHNDEFSTLVEQVSAAVAGHLSFARNVVLANVKDYAQRVTKDAALFSTSPASLFKIVQNGFPSLLDEGSLLDQEVSKAAGGTYAEPVRVAHYDAKGPQELLELIKFGSQTLDADVAKWLSTTGGTDFLVGVWDDHFADPMLSKGKSVSVITDI